MKFSYDAHLARELDRHHDAIDRAEREANERRERLPQSLLADIDDAEIGVIAEIIGADSMLTAKFRELLSVAMDPDLQAETISTAARSFADELLDVCVDLCVETNRDCLPWNLDQINDAMTLISARRMSERLRAASFDRSQS